VALNERRFQWREPSKRPEVFWRRVPYALAAAAAVFAIFFIVGIVHFDPQDLVVYAVVPVMFAVAATAISLERRTITVGADGVHVSGLFGVLPAHTIAYAHIGHAEVIARHGLVAGSSRPGGKGGVVVWGPFQDQRMLRLWSQATERFAARRLLVAALDSGIETQALLGSFRSVGVDATSIDPAEEHERGARLPRLIVIAVLGAIMLAVFLRNQGRTTARPGFSAPQIECITMRPGGAFEVRMKSSEELQQVQFSTTSYQAIKIPLNEIQIDRPASSEPGAEVRLRFRVALEPKQNYLVSIQDRTGVTTWAPFISRTNHPEGIGCDPVPRERSNPQPKPATPRPA
jgi:hypothetical protein